MTEFTTTAGIRIATEAFWAILTTEPADLEPHWREWTQSKSRSPKVWNDAYLAAFARAASLAIVTFDKGFALYMRVRKRLVLVVVSRYLMVDFG